jgi:LysM repeat protein
MRIDWNAIDQVNDPELGGAIEAYISKLEELSQSFEETQTTIESMEDLIREIKERNMQEYLEFEERVYQAIIDREQKVIDEYSALSDTISESNSNILSSLRESIDLERQIRDNTKTEEDIADKEARLAYLQRDTSGANQTEILKLQQELDDARQSYGDTLVDQAIDQLERDNEIAEQQRQEQIEIMQAQLDYAERTGQFWPETYDLIATSFNANGTMNENSALANLLMNSDAFAGMSKFGQMNWIKELVEEWLKAQEGLTNWRNENAQDIYTSAENAMSAYDINSGAQKSIWFDGKNWVDDKGNVYNNVQWDEQGQRYTYGSAQAAPATPAQTETPVSAPTQTSTQAQQYDTYTVKSGDNLSKIASKYGTTWQKIYDANKDIISNPNMIYPGWVLKIPKYAKGGLVDATGLAWLDGTKTSPEMVLSARDTENFIALRNALSQMLAQGGGKGGDNYFNIEINVDELANDYDVDQLADRIKKQIYDDSSYRNVNAISYLR